MPKFLLHGLWMRESGLNLWVEQVEGRKVVLPSQVPEGTFPPEVAAELVDERFRHRERVTLQTPRGKHVELRVPTAAFAPADAVAFLAALARYDDPSALAPPPQGESLAPDIMWLVRLFSGLSRFVRAGRVSLHVPYRDGAFYAQWQLGTGVDERGWLAEMIAAAPGVLTANNPSLDEGVSQTLVHWIATAILSRLDEGTRPYPWHDFVRSLLSGTPLRRGGAELARKLSDWNGSITAVNLQLVFIVEPPGGDDDSDDVDDAVDAGDSGAYEAEARWPVRAQVRSGTDSPRPVVLSDFDAATAQTLRRELERAIEVSDLVDPVAHPRAAGALFAEGEGEWDAFLDTEEIVRFVQRDAARLRHNNFAVMLPRAWSEAETRARLSVADPGDPHDSSTVTHLGFDTLVSYDWRLSVGDVELNDEEMARLIESKSGLVKLRGQWVLADSRSLARTRRYMDRLAAAHKDSPAAGEDDSAFGGTVTAAELRALALESAAEADIDVVEFAGSPWFTSLVSGTQRPAPERVELPGWVCAELREYQRRGVDWLYFMSRSGLGAVLADDMGLGKTLQLLTLFAVEAERGDRMGPSLVVAPTSVVGNWAREAARFVPRLRVLVHHGSRRLAGDELAAAIESADVVVTSYGVAGRDVASLARVGWDHVVLDEAQAIKNASTKASKSVRAIPARHRIALTGTPIENKLSELRSLLDFTNPGILGSQTFFRNHFAKVIESRRDEELAAEMSERLRRLTTPFILRRLKTDPAIIDDLPEKNEHIVAVDMTAEQAALYTALVRDVERELSRRKGMARKGLVLASITRIKQICNHPAHYLGDGSPVTVKGVHRSGKVQMLMQLLGEAMDSGQRVLIFTQYKAFGSLLQPYLEERLGEEVPFLHGGVGKEARDAMVERFQAEDGPRAMVLSLKAGGTGLNLTSASVVIHLDRWWNPAVENQATDRAYRIGQTKDVTVYKMITRGTLEESIQDVLDGKMQLAGTVVGEGEGWITELDTEDLARLMSYRNQED
ncbi:DEAD/DEAH box helicase [Corynebacterium liangguodongii]|uniref:ATP-dependent helicase n=1 Tax=Corynebacterium liangguodongii TaxID=2079535 RepID=A0A2S0WDH3_9CORY|nr:DEAD/DEAH box helicase [Corynebacterium liangguodongii]AWB83811.1 ATP-dependent helicase [Corynebacterium liangguodongii]PWB98932.1 ATP-dependent helicase [Corynebacterium liangguodongii]